MPIRHELRDEVLWFVTEGDVDYQEGLGVLAQGVEAARAQAPDARWDVVFDIRRSTENRSGPELVGVAQFVADHLDVLSGSCAIVASGTLHFGLARMFSAHAENLGVETVVVRDDESASRWIAERRALARQ